MTYQLRPDQLRLIALIVDRDGASGNAPDQDRKIAGYDSLLPLRAAGYPGKLLYQGRHLPPQILQPGAERRADETAACHVGDGFAIGTPREDTR